MVWTVEFTGQARKSIRKPGRGDAAKILAALDEIAGLEDPRSRGHILTGELGGLWRYRVGNWRIITRIEDGRLVILVLEVGHRSKIYR